MNARCLVVATGNAKKVVEVQGYLRGLEVRSLADHPGLEMPPEDGETFEANAAAKALHVARALGVPVLADDSGLEVEALGGAPGVRSARYAEGTDLDRVRALLSALEAVPEEARGARFVCALALATPDGAVALERGTVEGSILRELRGEGGFGYDPVFRVGRGERTMAELTLTEKNAISHRGQALRAMVPRLAAYFSLEHLEADRPAS